MNLIDNLKKSFKFYSDNFTSLFFIICLPATLISVIEKIVEPYRYNIFYISIYLILSIIFAPIFSLSAIIQVQNPSNKIFASIKKSYSYFWRFLIINIIVSVLSVVGFISFIFPAIIFMIIFSLINYVFIDYNSKIFETFALARFYAHKKLLKIISNTLFISIFTSIISYFIYSFITSLKIDIAKFSNFIPFTLTMSLIMPISIIYLNNFYQDIKINTDFSAYDKFPKHSKLIGFSIIFASIAVSALFIFAKIKIGQIFP